MAVTKQAIDAYAEYEQLVGGSKLMFGDAYDYIADKAQNAFNTVQLSQNEYLQQVNGFATGLKTALGDNEQAAAELADRIVTAEADVVAATGNSREAVENAFNGIMRSNYTMLDNLQLGITPTKEGFQSLIDSVNAWNAEHGKATQYTIDNVADAQSALIDYIEMQGLSGYAGEEAATTIQGSTAMMKAAWQNMLVGIADDTADFGTLIDNLVESVGTAAENILPRVETALNGITQLVGALAPKIAEALPSMLQSLLPSLIQGATNLVVALANALPSIITVLVKQIPTIVNGLLTAIPLILTALSESAPELIDTVVEVLIQVVQSLIDNAPMIIMAAIELINQLIVGIVGAIPKLVDALPQIIQSLVSGLTNMAPQLIVAGIQLIIQLAAGLIQAIPQLIAALPEIISAIVNGLVDGMGSIVEVGKNIVQGIWEGISGAADWLWDKITGWLGGVVDGIASFLGIHSPSTVMRDRIGKFLAQGIGVGFEDEMPNVEKQMTDALQFETMKASVAFDGQGGRGVNELLAEIIDKLERPIVLDDGTLVGKIAPQMDTALGQRAVYSGRYVLGGG